MNVLNIYGLDFVHWTCGHLDHQLFLSSRRSYRDDWVGREDEWVDHGPPSYSGSRDLGPLAPQALPIGRGDRSQQPPLGRRPRREPVDLGIEPPPPSSGRYHP